MNWPTYSSFLTDLCQHLANNGVGRWSTNGVYTGTGAPPIYLGTIPDTAGVSIAANIYAEDRYRDDGSPTLYVQFRIRGDRDPRTAGQIADKLFTTLHDHTNYQLDNGTKVLLSRRAIQAPPEQDTNARWYRIDSYTFVLNP